VTDGPSIPLLAFGEPIDEGEERRGLFSLELANWQPGVSQMNTKIMARRGLAFATPLLAQINFQRISAQKVRKQCTENSTH
jgi:hypothetical protein